MRILFNTINLIPNFGVHSLQVAFLSSEIARELLLDYKKAFIAGYLHDIGVLVPHEGFVLDDINSSYLVMHDVSSLDELTRMHTIIGSFIISQIEFLKEYSDIILKHHAVPKFLDERVESDIYANIISISEEISKYHFINENVDFEDLFFPILSIKNRFFEKVFDAAINCIKKEFVIWMLDDIKNRVLKEELIEEFMIETAERNFVDIGILISFIVDTKSKFTKDHSWRVATVAREMAKIASLDDENLFLAGLFHDIGKITTPVSILEKKGKLNDNEMKIMKKHVYYSMIILRNYSDKNWFKPAVRHQERIDGSGYPLKLKEDDFSFEDKILQVADYFSALLEDRPYREGFSKEKAFEITYETAKKGVLSKEAVDVLSEVIKKDIDFKNISYVSDVQKNIDQFVRGITI
ncbi:phosphohydrolase [Thermosipho melanesiensis]|uniref:Metal dependent phosphohydrolase n=2 Tax=Thermosipho melanesiensis TaxID=46541 RepID=A6LL33_THEM4|nr:HD domain-containing phosphohydrolase [Thermosipho melanesiensis]ABR30634.1 metal dependent phosphohydrolase [Thermosipho melanesiensis BI429]APT73773.1 phosphodiesterase [Thermosipho melanesiensis]OOC35713.1 phosphohydrolase [Thermosipho melanesiensis]OOC39012.1 phosphohydrolase [Thermosipho melanesiensis]OOC39160.1 phosphohydrolase [Thermosipho melanesiensis]